MANAPRLSRTFATRLAIADLDQSILGDLTKEWLSAVELKLSLGQQIKILRHFLTYLRSQRVKMMKRTPIIVKAAPKAAAKAAGGHRSRGRRVPAPKDAAKAQDSPPQHQN
jgi:hypothetical protein